MVHESDVVHEPDVVHELDVVDTDMGIAPNQYNYFSELKRHRNRRLVPGARTLA
jgi:hypothetical protein